METSSPAPHPSFYSWTKRSPERKSDLLKAQGHAREELDLAPRASLLLHHLGATNMMRVLRGGGAGASVLGMCRVSGLTRWGFSMIGWRCSHKKKNQPDRMCSRMQFGCLFKVSFSINHVWACLTLRNLRTHTHPPPAKSKSGSFWLPLHHRAPPSAQGQVSSSFSLWIAKAPRLPKSLWFPECRTQLGGLWSVCYLPVRPGPSFGANWSLR